MDNKGFATAEFLFVTLIILVIMTSMVALIGSTMDKTQTGSLGEARMMGEKIAEAVNTVYINGNGYTVYIDTPPESDFKFNATFTKTGYLTVSTPNHDIDIKLVSSNIKDSGSILIKNSKRYKITNINGTIEIVEP